jgi:hypothetical protein
MTSRRIPVRDDRERFAARAAASRHHIGIETERDFHNVTDVGLVVDMKDTQSGHATSSDRRTS